MPGKNAQPPDAGHFEGDRWVETKGVYANEVTGID